ncbi:MAG: serine/threonine-protein kinase [Cyanobacteria bacterium P01_D01_bin.1]
MATFSSNSIVTERLDQRYGNLRPIGQPFGYQQMLANDTKQQRSVVIKSIRIQESTSADDIACFEREIYLLKSLNHPTVPHHLESFRLDTAEGQGLVLVQSHQGGQTLEQQVALGKQYSEIEIRTIARQLLQGLVYLHRKGLVHRDIKPSNITVSEGASGEAVGIGQAAWLNFGTVQYLRAQRPDALVGTYGYMPMEQVRAQATFASDLYSLGATLVYLVTGSHLGDLPRNGLHVKFACSTDRLSADFQQWISWLIEPQVHDRPTSAKQALGALNYLPIAMLKRRMWQPTKSQTMPVPITLGGRVGAASPKENRYQPFFTDILSPRSVHSLKLVIRPKGLQSKACRTAIPPLLLGTTMLVLALYLINLVDFPLFMLSSMKGLAALMAAVLGTVGCTYSFRFLQSGLRQLDFALLRRIQIEIKDDVLLISKKHLLRSPSYLVNTKRENIYSISSLPDGSVMRILTNYNRTQTPCNCYKLSTHDGAITQRDIRWLTSLLNDWHSSSSSK